MPEIRRIREADAEAVVELWDRMVREVPDGAPLTEAGRRHLGRMLAITAWHRETFCLVAVEGDEVLGFGLGRVDIGDGLLPEAVGEIQELSVAPGTPETNQKKSVSAMPLAIDAAAAMHRPPQSLGLAEQLLLALALQ